MAVWDIALHKTHRHAGGHFVLNVGFRSDAERLVLFGPSGSGKTQTLRLMAGLSKPDAGHVRIGARTVYDRAAGVDLTAQQRALGLVFQDYALFPHLSVRQNIAFGLHKGWRNPAAAARSAAVETWLERFGLGGVAGLHPHQISGGQRQRAALARALVSQPQALLLDEPFAALDKALRQRLREELLEVQATLRLPLLLVTHDEDDVRLLAQDLVQLDHGTVVAQGLGPACGGALPGALSPVPR